MSEQLTNTSVQDPLNQIAARIANLEARFAGSWACQTRDEYEKALKSDVKQEILGYVTKIAIGLFLFLGGAGAIFVKLSVDANYQSENAKVIQNLQSRYDSQIKEDRTHAEWQRFHNYGVTYRYLAELYSLAPLPAEEQQKELNTIFEHAKTYYELALSYEPRQPSTHFELAQLYYTYARQFSVPEWQRNQKAAEEYQKAIDLASQDDVSRGWRADSLVMLSELELDEYAEGPASSVRPLLERAEKRLQRARTEFERAIPEVSSYNGPCLELTDSLLRQIDLLKPENAAKLLQAQQEHAKIGHASPQHSQPCVYVTDALWRQIAQLKPPTR